MSLIWKSISEYWIFSSTVRYYSFDVGFCTSPTRFNPMSFFFAEIPPEMLLQIMTETGNIIPVHRRIWY